jgi:hypothetical protein
LFSGIPDDRSQFFESISQLPFHLIILTTLLAPLRISTAALTISSDALPNFLIPLTTFTPSLTLPLIALTGLHLSLRQSAMTMFRPFFPMQNIKLHCTSCRWYCHVPPPIDNFFNSIARLSGVIAQSQNAIDSFTTLVAG